MDFVIYKWVIVCYNIRNKQLLQINQCREPLLYWSETLFFVNRKAPVAMTGAFFAYNKACFVYIKVFVINTCTFFPSFS